MMLVELEIASGPAAGRKAAVLEGDVLRVGRTEQDGLAVPDTGMSRSHFSVEFDGVICRLRDIGSRNGTFLNQTQVRDAEVRDGDEILAGKTRFVIRVQAADAPGAAAEIDDRHQLALGDDDPLVRREALIAAAWTRQRWLLEHCRSAARQPADANLDDLWLLGVLGKFTDLSAILEVGGTAALGPARFRVLGAYGHPDVVELLLAGIADDDAATAVAAGAAFTKMTGADIASSERATLLPADGSETDEFEQEFLEEAALPDLRLAAAHWKKVKAEFADGTRWCRGLDLSRGDIDQLLDLLDMESRWETCLRGRYEGTWNGGPAELEVFGGDRCS